MILVLCHGTFDWLHYGHVRHFLEAFELGDKLMVGVTADAFVRKGSGRPIFNEHERSSMIWALRCVDTVVICNAPNAVPLIEEFKPHIYCKGGDYAEADKAGFLQEEIAAVEKYGGRFVLTQHYGGWSTSKLIERLRKED